eukprot:2863819-Prymnesium_polylepis.1
MSLPCTIRSTAHPNSDARCLLHMLPGLSSRSHDHLPAASLFTPRPLTSPSPPHQLAAKGTTRKRSLTAAATHPTPPTAGGGLITAWSKSPRRFAPKSCPCNRRAPTPSTPRLGLRLLDVAHPPQASLAVAVAVAVAYAYAVAVAVAVAFA